MKYKPGQMIKRNEFINSPIIPEIRFRLLDIIEKKLVEELQLQDKEGYELIEVLNRQGPSSYSDDTIYKVLLRKK